MKKLSNCHKEVQTENVKTSIDPLKKNIFLSNTKTKQM